MKYSDQLLTDGTPQTSSSILQALESGASNLPIESSQAYFTSLNAMVDNVRRWSQTIPDFDVDLYDVEVAPSGFRIFCRREQSHNVPITNGFNRVNGLIGTGRFPSPVMVRVVRDTQPSWGFPINGYSMQIAQTVGTSLIVWKGSTASKPSYVRAYNSFVRADSTTGNLRGLHEINTAKTVFISTTNPILEATHVQIRMSGMNISEACNALIDNRISLDQLSKGLKQVSGSKELFVAVVSEHTIR